jgi:ferric-dicitrate binding protein FerR (iron transport regulator)
MDVRRTTRPDRVSPPGSRRRLLAALAAGVFAGCVPSTGPARRVSSPAAARGLARLVLGDMPSLVRVERQYQAIPASDGMVLVAGDVVETTGAYVELDFAGSGRVWLDADTRVQLGSLWLVFGRIFSSASPPFRVETEDVTASPEGTRFGMRRTRGARDWTMAVETGRVRCEGKNQRFRYDVRAGEILEGGPGSTPPPPSRGDLQREIGWVTRAGRRQKPPAPNP